MPTMTLTLDEDDWNTIQDEISLRQVRSRKLSPDGSHCVPDGESCLAGAIIAEAIRDLDEYRSMHRTDDT